MDNKYLKNEEKQSVQAICRGGRIRNHERGIDVMATLNTVFKKVFLEELQEEGFAKVKGRQPYLVRVVEGGEIIHILTCKTAFCWDRVHGRQYKAFEILGGVATVYRASIMDFSEAPRNNTGGLWTLPRFYYCTNKMDCDHAYRIDVLSSFGYNTDEEGSLYAAMQRALVETRKVMLSVFDKTIDLDSCAKFFMRYGQDNHEDLLYLKVNNRAELEEEVEKLLQEEIFEAENRNNYQNVSKEEYIANLPKNWGEYWKAKMANLDETLADSDKYMGAVEEMEFRKIKNTERLRSFGLAV